MPKIGVIARSERDFERDSKLEMNKVFRSTNPTIHKFQKVRNSADTSGQGVPEGRGWGKNRQNFRTPFRRKHERTLRWNHRLREKSEAHHKICFWRLQRRAEILGSEH